MKKAFLVAGFALAVVLTASAQNRKKEPPPPPEPPQAPVEMMKDVPPPPPPPPPPLPDDYKDFLKRNPSIRSLSWTFEDEIVVRLKSGKEERYNLEDNASRTRAEAKYGKLPTAPPPPPPAPPVPPKPPRAPEPEQEFQ